MPDQNVYSVSQISRYLKELFRQDFLLHHIYIKGEVSNCKYHSSGHLYFTLKDEGAVLSGVMWRSSIRTGLPFPVKEGDHVIVLGDIEIYERSGKYQLYAKEIRVDGSGAFYQEFERRKAYLEEMGMFSQEYKKSIPGYVRTVGIVTAPTGAAIQDIRSISLRRNPYVQLVLYPSLVQGEAAVPDIVNGIETLDAMGLDVLIVGRGGGSIEDLWAFNSEEVAYAIFRCRTPVISAVGHETDTTIADYVADLRAPTPSAAAELAVGEMAVLLNRIRDAEDMLQRRMQEKLLSGRQRTMLLESRLKALSPHYRLNENRQHLADLERRLDDAAQQKMQRSREKMRLQAQRLDGLSPLKQMQRGYAFVTDPEGKTVTCVRELAREEALTLHMTDGTARVRVEETSPGTRDEAE